MMDDDDEVTPEMAAKVLKNLVDGGMRIIRGSDGTDLTPGIMFYSEEQLVEAYKEMRKK